jgi:transposase
MWYKKGKSKGGKGMKERVFGVFGCDVSKDYIILHDGSQAYKLSLENFKSLQKLVNNSIVVMEQTGAYGLRWGQVLEDLGAKVYIADGKDFKNFKLYQAVRKKMTIRMHTTLGFSSLKDLKEFGGLTKS